MAAMMDGNETLLVEGKPLLAEDGSRIQKEGELLTLTGEEPASVTETLLNLFWASSLPVGGRAFGREVGSGRIPFVPNGSELGGENRFVAQRHCPCSPWSRNGWALYRVQDTGLWRFRYARVDFASGVFRTGTSPAWPGKKNSWFFSWGCAWWPLKSFVLPLLVARYRGGVVDRRLGVPAMVGRWPNSDIVWSPELFRELPWNSCRPSHWPSCRALSSREFCRKLRFGTGWS